MGSRVSTKNPPDEAGGATPAELFRITASRMTGAHNYGMGDVLKARLHTGGNTIDGEALLETAELIFRGPRRVVIPFATIRSVEANGGRLTINGDFVLEVGTAAAKWAEKIRNPKTVLQKLGIKSGQSVAILNFDDAAFVADLEKAGANVTTGKPKKNSDAIFYCASTR